MLNIRALFLPGPPRNDPRLRALQKEPAWRAGSGIDLGGGADFLFCTREITIKKNRALSQHRSRLGQLYARRNEAAKRGGNQRRVSYA
jgi:hypothetical protein